jgi:hypothetical protein
VLPASVQQAAAARYEDQYGPIEDFPDSVLGAQRERALLFKHLATLRTDAPLGWRGPGPEFTGWAEKDWRQAAAGTLPQGTGSP